MFYLQNMQFKWHGIVNVLGTATLELALSFQNVVLDS